MKEAQVKLLIGEWLCSQGFRVFDEKPNPDRPEWGIFEVRNVQRGKCPDLMVSGNLAAAQTLNSGIYVAIEIKPGYKHKDILDGFDATLDYFADYMWGAEYCVNNEAIEIAAFVFATLFSREGYLFEQEGKFSPQGIVRGPWDAYPMTFTISRLLWRQKDNMLKRFQSLSGIPKVEKKLKGKMHAGRVSPEIGVMVRNPKDQEGVLLMLSKNPYHWRLEPEKDKVRDA